MPPDTDWISKAASLVPDGRALIGGIRRGAACGNVFPLISPRDGKELAAIAACDELDVALAVERARDAEQQGVWSRASPKQRREVLLRWEQLIEREQDELALLVSLEMGKPIKAALSVELRSLRRSIRWYAEICDKLEGRHPQVGNSAFAVVEREPAGVVGIVLPWNFPLSMVGYDIAPALAIGNSVVAKPSEQAPLSVLRSCELALEAGVPSDVLAVVPGLGETAGAALGRHPDVDVIVITGSTLTGRAFLRYSAESNGKRVWPKLGGKSTFIICRDAPSINAACEAAVWGAYFNQGQMCTGGARILVEQQVYEEVIDGMVASIDALHVGDPLKWETDIGPLATTELAHVGASAVRDALTLGASIVRGSREGAVATNVFPPTLLRDLPLSSQLFNEEIFAPIAGVASFSAVEDAVAASRKHGFGMGISVWTESIRTTFESMQRAKAGTVWINCFEADDLSVPFGGVKRSGYGRDKGLEALDKYSDLKTTWLQLDGLTYW